MKNSHHHLSPVGKFGTLGLISMIILIAFCLLVTILSFSAAYYLWSHSITINDFIATIGSDNVLSSIRLSFATTTVTILLIVSTAIPAGYALSRREFTGKFILNTIVDVPLVVPPIVIGLLLLTFFGTASGGAIKNFIKSIENGNFIFNFLSIVICQYIVSISYCIRSMKAAFDSIDRNYESVAYSLGCSPSQAFFKITLPQARNNLIAGSIMAWARALGVFGPIQIFVGTSENVLVMPTSMWLELNVGNIEVALIITFITLLIAGSTLLVVHWLAPGKNWT